MADDQKDFGAADPNLLARYRGEKPSAPDWFTRAVATPYTEHFIDVEGAKVRYQVWGDRTKPGLLLVHGNGAHAHWYDFTAPYFAEDYHVVAMTFAGMGDSDWRDSYNVGRFTMEQLAVCEVSGLFDNGRKPVIAAHSFGGFITMHTGSKHSDRFSGLIIVDSPVRPPEDPWDGPPERARGNRAYATLESALARFRLAPPQPCDNHFIVDYIARHSLKEIQTDSGQTGWTWKFDPFIWQRFEAMASPEEMLRGISCRLSIMHGQDSVLFPARTVEYMRGLREDITMIAIPEAQHHVMLDQPLAYVSAIRMQLAAWAH